MTSMKVMKMEPQRVVIATEVRSEATTMMIETRTIIRRLSYSNEQTETYR